MQEGCRIAVDIALGLGQLEELVEIPAKVSDHAGREPFRALLVQKGLQLIAREAAQGSVGQGGFEMTPHPIDVGDGCRRESVSLRGPEYCLRETEVDTLQDIGRFRVVDEADL